MVTPPSYRGDLRMEEDLIEEVARVGGYDSVPLALPEVRLGPGGESEARALVRRVRRLLVAEGLSEMVTLAFTDALSQRVAIDLTTGAVTFEPGPPCAEG